MSARWKRNTVVATMVLLVCAAVALNWKYTGEQAADAVEETGTKILGEATLVSGEEDGGEAGTDEEAVYTGGDYFASARLTRQQLEQSLRADLSNFWQAYRNNLEVILLEEENLIAAKENYEIAMERYLLGDLPGIEMREAQKSLLDAEERILTAKYNTKVCEISLQQISGNVMTYME